MHTYIYTHTHAHTYTHAHTHTQPHTYRAMVANVPWPLDEGEEVDSYMKRIVLSEKLPEPTLSGSVALEEVRMMM